MLSHEWTEADREIADRALDRWFPGGAGMSVWTADAVTDRSWNGTTHGLRSVDTRIQFKNNAEYHGMEVHAWQYFAAVMYPEARDHFYAAALSREVDSESILAVDPTATVDEGHLKATDTCIRLGRYCQAIVEHGHTPARPEHFGLTSAWVNRREQRAQAQLDAQIG